MGRKLNNSKPSISISMSISASDGIGLSENGFNVNRETKLTAVSTLGCSSVSYNYMKDGLYYGGTCYNIRCDAYYQYVTAQKGYGIIRPMEDVKSESNVLN